MAQGNIVTIENAEILFRNFTGVEGMYNRPGDRSFVVKLPRDVADDMLRDGWNIKTLKPREDDDEPAPYIQVAVGYKGRPPTVVMITSRGRTQLDEETIDELDNVDILTADVVIRPYDWEVRENKGRKAYLQSMYVTVNEDPLQLKYGMPTPATVAGPMMEPTGPYVPSDEATH